jgi:uncharacterized OsmC-like protein
MTTQVVLRQNRLQQHYREAPADALITERARTANGVSYDPFHGHLEIGGGAPDRVPEQGLEFGIHSAVGGDHDLPNPGHLLLGALAACMDSTLRMMAERFEIELEALEVSVDGHVDVRGCLMLSAEAPVGFRDIHCRVALRPARGAPPLAIKRLMEAAERCCVILQTLRNATPVTASVALLSAEQVV